MYHPDNRHMQTSVVVEATRVTWSTSVDQALSLRPGPSVPLSEALSSDKGEASTPCPRWWLHAVINNHFYCLIDQLKWQICSVQKWVDRFHFAFDFTCSFQMLVLSMDISSTLWFIKAISMFSIRMYVITIYRISST